MAKLHTRHNVPVYGPRYVPRFIRGIMAAVQLGRDEDGFLSLLERQYGPVVYLPWPLKQFFVLDNQTIQHQPIRIAMQHAVFGSQPYIGQSGVLETKLFAAHSRGLSKLRLEQPVNRFNSNVEQSIDQILSSQFKNSSPVQIDLINLVTNMLYQGATPALFGNNLLEFETHDQENEPIPSSNELQTHFWNFDNAFPLLTAQVPLQRWIPTTRQGIKGRQNFVEHVSKWIQHDLPGLNEGVVRDMVDIGNQHEWQTIETAKLVLGTYWALQANAPFASAHHIINLCQSPLIKQVQLEIQNYLNQNQNQQTNALSFKELSNPLNLPLLSSTIWETLRLNSSSFSIRIVTNEKGYVVGQSQSISNQYKQEEEDDDDEQYKGHQNPLKQNLIIPEGELVICATRVSQMSTKIWGPDALEWKGDRFVIQDDHDGTKRLNQPLIKLVRSFGGGVSMCEGRHLALVELKSFAIQFLSTFDVNVIEPSSLLSTQQNSKYRQIKFAGTDKLGWTTGLKPGRVGMGIHQQQGQLIATLTKRTKQS
ncbi:hypothetical protein OIO90_006629 [Microbotryomycetes sp. JL221]|nr:hypothetical protein OIO90_006629 [Microbotryomycetes sp. JL221]